MADRVLSAEDRAEALRRAKQALLLALVLAADRACENGYVLPRAQKDCPCYSCAGDG